MKTTTRNHRPWVLLNPGPVNVTDRVNFTNPTGDRQAPSSFLRLTGLTGGTGFPRQSQLGLRLGF